MTQNMFNSEIELGKFLGSIDIISDAFRAIVETSLAYELHTTPSGIKVLAFQNCSFEHTTRFLNKEFDLVSLENHKTVDFISTKVNSKVSVNGAAIQLFERLSEDLKELEKQHIKSPLIITGCGLGGYLAILSALRLQQAIDVEESNGEKKTKRPVCITFGAPLVGDEALQKAISERPMWKSNFLNVVAKIDPVASVFSSSSLYKPFGTFMFCTESGGYSAFEDQEAILEVLDDMARPNIGKVDMYTYGDIISLIRRKPLYRGVSVDIKSNLTYLSAGIALQFKEVGVIKTKKIDLVSNLETKQAKMIKTKRIAVNYEPTKKLNDSKISLTYMEWYMKNRKPKGGYYDSFKENAQSREDIKRKEVIVEHQRRLNQYYKNLIAEKNLMPQKEGAKLRKRWLLSGNNYRWIVEPLDIADYYKEGKRNYIENRPTHYELIEKWYNEDKPKQSAEKKTKAASLTEDSCLWARVEEASISLEDLKAGGSSNNVAHIEKQLEDFEAYVMREVNEYSVSPDIFLEGSSLMKWWSKYKEYKGTSYASEFANFMNNKIYQNYH